MNYNKTVSACRESARDFLRLKQTNMLRDTILELKGRKSTLLKKQEAHDTATQEQLDILNYDLSHLDAADPRSAKKREVLEKQIADVTEAAPTHGVQVAKLVADLDKMIVVVEEDIAKIQSGETKVDKDELSRVTQELCYKLVSEGACFENVETPEADPDAGVVSDES